MAVDPEKVYVAMTNEVKIARSEDCNHKEDLNLR